VWSFGSAVLLIFVAIGVLLRSVRLTLISFVPNVMPIAWTLGLMGFLGIDLSTGTAMIASSVIGLVVDDTIHYLVHYSRLYAGDAPAAVRATTAEVGAPLLVNNVVLVLGFWVGCFGSFKPTIYFSLLSGVTMITALVCDLFVTPASLVLLDRGRASAR
jgi:predicted RND superfamily exporter protein